jgi:hypothetical protein
MAERNGEGLLRLAEEEKRKENEGRKYVQR